MCGLWCRNMRRVDRWHVSREFGGLICRLGCRFLGRSHSGLHCRIFCGRGRRSIRRLIRRWRQSRGQHCGCVCRIERRVFGRFDRRTVRGHFGWMRRGLKCREIRRINRRDVGRGLSRHRRRLICGGTGRVLSRLGRRRGRGVFRRLLGWAPCRSISWLVRRDVGRRDRWLERGGARRQGCGLLCRKSCRVVSGRRSRHLCRDWRRVARRLKSRCMCRVASRFLGGCTCRCI